MYFLIARNLHIGNDFEHLLRLMPIQYRLVKYCGIEKIHDVFGIYCKKLGPPVYSLSWDYLNLFMASQDYDVEGIAYRHSPAEQVNPGKPQSQQSAGVRTHVSPSYCQSEICDVTEWTTRMRYKLFPIPNVLQIGQTASICIANKRTTQNLNLVIAYAAIRVGFPAFLTLKKY